MVMPILLYTKVDECDKLATYRHETFYKSRVWDKVRGNTVIFGQQSGFWRYPNSICWTTCCRSVV